MVDSELDELPNAVGHTAFQLEDAFYDAEALRGVEVKTMGRTFAEDPIFFEAASAAGATAAMMAVMSIEEEAAAAVENAEKTAATAVMGGCSPQVPQDMQQQTCPSADFTSGDCASSCPSASSCGKLN
jgi:hypothetical protein